MVHVLGPLAIVERVLVPIGLNHYRFVPCVATVNAEQRTSRLGLRLVPLQEARAALHLMKVEVGLVL